MIQISIKHLICLVLSIVVAAVILITMSHSVITIANANIDTSRVLIPAMGSVAGGIIGGIVAVIIAAYNASRALKNEQTKQMHTSLTMLKLIRQEMLDNISVLENVTPSSDEYNILKTQLSDDTWKSTMINLLISDELLVRLNVCYKKISLFKILQAEDINSETLNTAREQLNLVLEMVNSEINTISSKIKE